MMNKNLTLEHIRNAVAPYFGISPALLIAIGRSELYATARKMVCYFGNYYGCTDREIAAIIRRDRTTVIAARNDVTNRIAVDKHFASMVRNLQYLIENPLIYDHCS
jgi:chromosomal replication initiation ATPase DnaA